jgi:transcriptional regulator with XRE-family HTH domain
LGNKLKLGEKCALLARLSGLSQAELSRRLSIQPSNLNPFLKGHGDVRAELFVKILQELSVDIEDLMNREISRASGIQPEFRVTPGQAWESIVKSLGASERKAMVNYVIKTAQVNLGTRSRPLTGLLKHWMKQ